MKADPRRARLGLPQMGALTEEAIRAAYWRLVAQTREFETLAGLREAKTALLHEVGVRVPKRPRR